MQKSFIVFILLSLLGQSYGQNSLLSKGEWHSLVIEKEGIYKMDKSFLIKMGIDVNSINPKSIKIYSNHGGMLPEKINTAANQDLKENAILVSGEADGKFDENDFIVFYAQGADVWKVNNSGFTFEKNLYSTSNAYYFTFGGDDGKRIVSKNASMGLTEEAVVDKFDFLIHHEKEMHNLINSGKLWVGELFDFDKNQEFNEDISGVIQNSDVEFRINTYAHSVQSSLFTSYVDGVLLGQAAHNVIQGKIHATSLTQVNTFKKVNNSVKVKLRYSKPSSASKAWLNYYELRGKSLLNSQSGIFRFQEALKYDNIKYSINGTGYTYWNVTDPNNMFVQQSVVEGGKTVFKQNTNKKAQVIASIDFANLPEPGYKKKLSNTSLRDLAPAEYLIITHTKFKGASDELKKIYTARGMEVHVVDIHDIYDCFNYGSQDISAIRNFLRQNYYKNISTNHPLKYVLLMGDASFDYLDRVSNNTNYIPVFESISSVNENHSYCTDDFYGYLGDNEGDMGGGEYDLKIALGRFTVNTSDEAFQMVDKVRRYYDPKSLGDWRTKLTFAADDTDEDWDSVHLFQSDYIAEYVDTNDGIFLNNKIYLDAYKQENLSGGERYPDASSDINKNMTSSGNLFLTYTGHGSEERLSSESLIDKEMINAWDNEYKMPVFFTATCEFTRFDNAEHVSGGERVFLNPNGGAIAMMTTTRVVYVQDNFALQQGVWKDLLKRSNGGKLRTIGDALKEGKNRMYGDNERRFALIGDPALKLAIPEFYVVTDSINNISYDVFDDTLKALSKVLISGSIQDYYNNLKSDFNGDLYVAFFDKKNTLNTRQNGQYPPEPNYKLWNSIIYKGKVSVEDGKFSFSFVIPKDISYKVGTGKLMYYAEDGKNDAAGNASNIKIGSSSGAVSQDNNKGPELKLYMDDYTFVSGGLTKEDPLFIAAVKDVDGINTTGSGIGREMIVTLDRGTEQETEFVVNKYFQSKINSYQEGEVRFPLSKLTCGKHTIGIKVWDVFNNSSSSTIDFNVVNGQEIKIENLHNIPNPFSVKTTIKFDHNFANQKLTVNLNIINMSGKYIYSKEYNYDDAPSRISLDVVPNHANLSNGLYVARVIIRTDSGEMAKSSIKLVVVK